MEIRNVEDGNISNKSDVPVMTIEVKKRLYHPLHTHVVPETIALLSLSRMRLVAGKYFETAHPHDEKTSGSVNEADEILFYFPVLKIEYQWHQLLRFVGLRYGLLPFFVGLYEMGLAYLFTNRSPLPRKSIQQLSNDFGAFLLYVKRAVQ